MTVEDVDREWHRVGQPAWSGKGVLYQPHSHHLSDYTVIATALNGTPDPRAALTALVEYFWLAPQGAVGSGRVTHPTPHMLAEKLTRDLSEALAWKAGAPSASSHGVNGHRVSRAAPRAEMYEPFPELPKPARAGDAE